MAVVVVRPDTSIADAINRASGLLLNAYMKKLAYEREQELLNKKLQQQKELLAYKQQLDEQDRNKRLNTLFGYTTPTIELTQPNPMLDNPVDLAAQQFLSGNMQDNFTSSISSFLNPQAQPQPTGLIQKFKSLLPSVEVGQKQVGGLFSDSFINKGIPTAKDYVIAQAYGFNLPKVEKKTNKFALGKPIKTVDENGNPVWKQAKLNKETGEIVYETLPVAKEETKGNIKISESKPFVGEDGKLYFIREYIKPNGEIITKKFRYYGDNGNSNKNSQNKKNNSIILRPNQVFNLFKRLSKKKSTLPKKKSTDVFGTPVEIERNVSFNDLLKFFSVKEIYIKAKSGKYKLVGSDGLTPLIEINGEAYRMVGERDGEPIISVNYNGQTLALPASKVSELGKVSKIKGKSISPVRGNTSVQNNKKSLTKEEYLSKWGLR